MIEISKGVFINPQQITTIWRGDVGERKSVLHVQMSSQAVYWCDDDKANRVLTWFDMFRASDSETA